MDTTECRYLLAVKDITIVWGGWIGLRKSAAIWSTACMFRSFRIEAKEQLTAVGTVRGQPLSETRITGRLTISSRQGCQTSGNLRSHTKDKRCELAKVPV
jgi:hypothetical protein